MSYVLSAPTRLLAIAASLALAACSSTTEPKDGDSPPVAISQLPRALTATEARVRDASNSFSFSLFGKVSAAELQKNTFLSPLSASFALGMVANGANGTTWDEIQTALKLGGMTQPEVNSGYKSLIELLTSLDPSVQMKIANSIWYRQNFAFHQTFFDTTKKYFNAEVKGLNFSDVPASLNTINGWVSSATNDRIKKVLDGIDPNDVMFLINAIYFKGSWRDKFDVAKTTTETFTTSAGVAQSVRMMNRTGKMSYTQSPQYQAVDLPYGNSAFSMTVVLPKAGQDINTLATSLSVSGWQSLITSLHVTEVALALPKLKLDYEVELKPTLKDLGMKAAFGNSQTDFSRMTAGDVFISFVKQNSFVNVDEEGTEAAAVPTIGVQVVSMPTTMVMRVDRPYLFVIRERLTGTIMFMGRIVQIPA